MLMIDFRFSVFRNSFKDTCSLTTHYLIDVIHLRAFFFANIFNGISSRLRFMGCQQKNRVRLNTE